MGACRDVAALADAEQMRLSAAGILSGHQADPGGQLPSVLRCLRVPNARLQRACRQRSNVGNSFQLATRCGYDKGTKAVHCEVTVTVTLPSKYKSDSFIESAGAVYNSRIPAELFGTQPVAVPVGLTVQAEVGGKHVVITSADLEPLYDSLLVLATAKWQVDMSERARSKLKQLPHSR